MTVKLITEGTKSFIPSNGSPLDQTITTAVTVIIAHSSTAFTDVRDKLRFLFDIAHDGGKGISVRDTSMLLKFFENILLLRCAIRALPRRSFKLHNRYFNYRGC